MLTSDSQKHNPWNEAQRDAKLESIPRPTHGYCLSWNENPSQRHNMLFIGAKDLHLTISVSWEVKKDKPDLKQASTLACERSSRPLSDLERKVYQEDHLN